MAVAAEAIGMLETTTLACGSSFFFSSAADVEIAGADLTMTAAVAVEAALAWATTPACGLSFFSSSAADAEITANI